MHYCCYVLTHKYPSDKVIKAVLAPYESEPLYEKHGDDPDFYTKIKPAFTWDWYQVGGRYCGKLKLKVDGKDEKYRWGFSEKEPRFRRLFRSYTLDEMMLRFNDRDKFLFSEEHYFQQMGMHDGFLYVDGGLIADMMNIDDQADLCYCIATDSGIAIARNRYDGEKWVDTPDFDKAARQLVDSYREHWIAVVDLHD